MHPDYQLVLAANRDEYHRRPSRELHFWPDNPEILAGRDLQAGGTWLAAHRQGKFAAVTNYRERARTNTRLESRGALVTDFVTGAASAASFATTIDANKYAGFSLLAKDRDDMYYVSNRGDPPICLDPGVYGLSNAALDTPWPKVQRSRDALSSLLAADTINATELLRIMTDRTCAPTADVEAGDISFDLARALTAPFIVSADYGTRCSTVLLWSNAGNVELSERRFDVSGQPNGDAHLSFKVANN